jgi:Bifunctional DNA primase/polymerase, N-terminal
MTSSSTQTATPSDMLEAARCYLALGWRVLPVLFRDKAPGWADAPGHRPYRQEGWQSLRLTDADLPRYFGHAPSNLGVLLGETSHHLADVDLDCAETVELAPLFLPPTWTFGRGSKPRSHWIYVAEGASYEKFLDVATRTDEPPATLVELRANRTGMGTQTVFPPSVHTSGESISWTDDCDATDAPRTINAAVLREQVARLAAAALVMRHAGRRPETTAWLERRGPCPSVTPEVARRVRSWSGLPNTAPAPRRSARAPWASDDLRAAAERYNREHGRELPRSGGQCPICQHRGCFGQLPEAPERWACFSAGHTGAGIQGDTCWQGDMLDLDAHAAGVTRAQLLRRQGYLKEGKTDDRRQAVR